MIELRGLLKHADLNGGGNEVCIYGFCRFLRSYTKYQPLFFSTALHDAVVDKLTSLGQEVYLEHAIIASELPKDILIELFYFQINGCLAICKRNIGASDDVWETIQCRINQNLRKWLRLSF